MKRVTPRATATWDASTMKTEKFIPAHSTPKRERIEYPSGVKEYGLKQRRGEYPTCERVEYPNGNVEYNVVYGDGFRRIAHIADRFRRRRARSSSLRIDWAMLLTCRVGRLACLVQELPRFRPFHRGRIFLRCFVDFRTSDGNGSVIPHGDVVVNVARHHDHPEARHRVRNEQSYQAFFQRLRLWRYCPLFCSAQWSVLRRDSMASSGAPFPTCIEYLVKVARMGAL
jgi:hypothetical protein